MKFKDVLTENKKRKHLRGIRERAKEKKDEKKINNRKQMKRQAQVYENLKLGD